MLKALLPSPLKVLSMTSSGSLIIPDHIDVNEACSHPLPEESTKELGQWREEFPRPQQEERASTPKKVADADPANGGAAPVTDGSTQKELSRGIESQ